MPDIPLGAIDRLIRKAGATRISLSASSALRSIAEDFCIDIAKIAVECSRHAGRKTISEDDVHLAFKLLRERQSD